MQPAVVSASIEKGAKVTSSESGEWTVRRVLAWTTGYLRDGGTEASRFEAESLLAHALGDDRLRLYLSPDRVLNATERARYRTLIRQRRKGVPLAYLLESMPFMDASLRVTPDVLIPRPETEELVEWVIQDTSSSSAVPERAIDFGTGSGAMAVALALAWPTTTMIAVDRAPGALALAQANARDNGVAERVRFVCADWGSALQGQVDLIVANPPYVATEAWAELPTDVRDQEPAVALDGGPQGTRALKQLIADAPRLLVPGGRMYLEIGAAQRDAVADMLAQADAIETWEIRSDRAGRPRFVRARAGA